MKIAHVHWKDAWFSYDDTDKREPKIMDTVGILVDDDPKGITVAQDMDEDGFRALTFIPRVLIQWVNFYGEEK